MHKKILFGFFFVFLSLFCVSGVHAQQLTTSQCAAQKSTTTGAGGVCKLIVLAGDGCSGTEVRVGDCENGLLSSKYACCVVGGTAATGVNSGSKYIPLEKVPFITGTSFQEYVKGLYVLGLVLVVLSAVFMLVIGGFTYLTSAGNTSAISSAKHIIYGALFGLVLALVSYIILNTINPDLVNVNISTLQPLATRGGSAGGAPGQGGTTGSFAAKQYTGNALFTDAQARDYLNKNGLTVNKANCASATQTNCTSLDQFPGVMAGIAVAIGKSCNTSVVITGGTEAGHATHGPGRAAMDIGKSAALDQCLSKYPKVGESGGRPIYKYNQVKIWFEDSAHYHVWEPLN